MAANALDLTGKDLLKHRLVDAVIPEALGGAHRNIHDTIYNVEQYIIKTLRDLKRTRLDNLLANRYKKLRSIGDGSQKVFDRKKPRKKPAEKPKIPDRLSAAEQLRKAKEAPTQAPVETTD